MLSWFGPAGRGRATARAMLVLVVWLVAAACSDALSLGGDGSQEGAKRPDDFQLSCNIPTDFLFDGGPGRDGIPALTNPTLVRPGDPGTEYLAEYAAIKQQVHQFPDVRVVGLVVDDRAVAIPHNILWWHEIVNIDLGGRRLAVTYCPLTGSALVFDATAARSQRFGVSGLVLMNNLVMFDAETESLWPQMMRGARCGPQTGAQLVSVPHVEMRWDAWQALHPTTEVVSSATGWDRDYTAYPYDLYETTRFTLFPMPRLTDRRLEVKDRVLGIPERNGGMAFAFKDLAMLGPVAIVPAVVGGRSLIVLWGTEAQTATAYEPLTQSGPATLELNGTSFVDQETGSVWTVEGRAIEGPRAGEQLVSVPDTFVAFWFAWINFQTESDLWMR